MKLHKSLPVLAAMAAALLCPLPAAAETIFMPKLLSIDVKCQSRDGANHTVHIVTQPDDPMWEIIRIGERVDYTFRNTATQQAVTFTKTSRDRVPSFPLSQGNYDLTIGYATDNGLVRNTAQVLYKGISVPHVVSTGGRGSGCAFA